MTGQGSRVTVTGDGTGRVTGDGSLPSNARYPSYPIRGPSQMEGLEKYHAYRVSNSGKQSSFIAAPSAAKYDCIGIIISSALTG